MTWIRRLLKLGEMTGEAVARQAFEDVVCMAGRASLRGVDAEERERSRRMIERPQLPVGIRGLVARLARRRESRRRVIRVGRLLILRLVAGEAVGRYADVDMVLVARIARRRRVDPDERIDGVIEAGLVPCGIGRLVAILASRREAGGSVGGILASLVVFAVA
jgi:hypothetical protein